jgi:hypothetical protein
MDFFKRVKNHVKMSNTTIEDFISDVFEGSKDRDSFNGWKRRNVLPRADEAIKIAKAMGMTVEYLVTGRDVVGLSSEEWELVAKYRNLSGDDKRNVQALIDSMLSVLGVGKKDIPA